MTFYLNLVQLLRQRAAEQPDRLAYAFLRDGEEEEARLTYAQLEAQARAIASFLRSRNAAGERVLLLFPPGLDYVSAFFGCLFAGAIAVPTYPPRPNRSLLRLQLIARDARPTIALTIEAIRAKVAPFLAHAPELGALEWCATDTLDHRMADEWRQPSLTPETLAFLQYTSGSTAAPKGVMVSHGNLLHNEQVIQTACGHTTDSTFVGWLPLYHDMGLIGNVLQPLFIGAPGILMSPVAFLQSPIRWLRAITRYRAATSGGPNFAYDLCVRRATDSDRETLDLSSWTTAFNGAEPVRRQTLDRFAGAFRECGFRREAFYPCYGLAEATLFVTGGRYGTESSTLTVNRAALAHHRVEVSDLDDDIRSTQTLVGCGHTQLGQRVLIVDPKTSTICAPAQIGEIWVAGDSVARGYWNRQEDTVATFQARLADIGDGPFLRTGDTGFLHDGELFVTGRLKDLIIIRGRNHYPQDIELTVERSHPVLRPGCGAAFAIDAGGEERLVVIQEVQEREPQNLEEVIARIRHAVAEEHELQVHAVALLSAGSVPKTSSGKIRRHACREEFVEGRLNAVVQWREDTVADPGNTAQVSAALPRSVEEVEVWLRSRLAVRLGQQPETIDFEQPLTRCGIDSLGTVEIAHAAEIELGAALALSSFFNAPSLSILAAWLFAHTPDGVARLDQQPRSERDKETEHPLSRGQQALFFLHQLNPESAVYNIANAARLHAEIDLERLRQAVQKLIDRHAALRSTFTLRDGKPVQRLHERMDVAFDVFNASDWDEASLRARLQDEAHRPFDLEHGPLLRVNLFTVSPRAHVLLLSVHHIVADLWSLGILLSELEALYVQEPAFHLPPLKVEYVDYVRQQEEMLTGPQGEKLRQYWRDRLSGELPVLSLLPGGSGAPKTNDAGAASITLGAELTELLKRLSKSHDATIFMTLLACYSALLHRYTGQQDILIGTPIACRERVEFAPVVGYFVNTLPLRLEVTRDLSFCDLLEETRRAVLSAIDHQAYPLSVMVDQLKLERDVTGSSFIQTAFVMQQTPPHGIRGLEAFALGLEGVRLDSRFALESMALERRTTPFDITLTIAEVGGQLEAILQYNSALLDTSTARQMLRHYQRLLESVAESATCPVGELPLLTRDEIAAMQSRRGSVVTEYAVVETLHESFEAQAARTPEAIAVGLEDERVSYAELNARANRLARHLRRSGVSEETRVGVMMERSVELVVAILGVLKSGGAYVPLDPAYPAERLRLMTEDARLQIVVTDGKCQPGVLAGTTAVCIDVHAKKIEEENGGNLASLTGPENAAYIIYTSGSTGSPKGVVVTHRNVQRLFAATRDWFEFSERDVWTLFHSYAFDFSVWELWGALLHGGRVVVVPYLVSRSPDAFHQLLVSERVTVLNQTPSAFRQLIHADESANGADPLNLRFVIFGGEALEVRSLRPWIERHGDSKPRLVNMYGITETTVHVTYRAITQADLESGSAGSPIGISIPDQPVYVLDQRGQLVPNGVVGELYVGGAGVARGYLNRPELSAERFLPDPFSADPRGRMYRSGDLGRILMDSELQYLGRADEQVKVRGFRIEPGEIEAVLSRHAGVREAVVVAHSSGQANGQLVAYVVPAKESALIPGELRAYLQDHLPDYMIPAVFISLESLPLTVNGKLDRRALPVPEAVKPDLSTSFRPPRNEAETILACVWGDVLGVDQVGIDDNFFELGGDSIRSIQVMSRAREQGFDFSLSQLFKHQTVAELAGHVVKAGDDGELAASTEPFRLVSDEDRRRLPDYLQDAYPLTKLQLGLIFHSDHSRDYETYVTTLQLRARLDTEALQQAVDLVVARHEMLRTSFDLSTFNEPLQLVHRAVDVPVELFDLSDLPRDEQDCRITEWLDQCRTTRFDWKRPPLVRCYVHRRSADTFQFSVAEPFLDGWSVASLLTELFTIYSSLLNGTPQLYSPLKASIRNYVELEQAALASEDTRAFWLEKLDECEPSHLPRPASTPAPPPARPVVQRFDVPLPAELSVGLRRHVTSLRLPLKSLLLAVHLKVLSFLNGGPDVVTGLLYNGRPEIVDGERLLGLFLNAVPLRLRLENGTWIDLIKSVFAAERELLPHRRYPLAELQRVHGRGPLFDTVFNFTHFHVYQGLEELESIEVLDGYASEQTYFDLTAQFNMDHASAQPKLRLSLDYRATALSEEQVERIGNYYARALSSMVQDPLAQHQFADLLSDAERAQLLADWNDTTRSDTPTEPLHKLIEAQVDLTPQNIALVFEAQELTYEELNRRANRLAHYLKAEGVKAESLVAVLMERSVELVVSLLAVMKAGAAYLPLEPGYPKERLTFMLEDAFPAVVLTQRPWLPLLETYAGRVLCPGYQQDSFAESSGENLKADLALDNPAYVIYTSGSTGVPKGVVNTHRGILNRLHWMQDAYHLTGTDRVLQKTPFSFDVSGWEFFWPLLTGACLVIARPEGHRDAAYLIELIKEQGITTIHFVPSMLQAFLEEQGVEACASLKRVICSGEALSFELQEQFFARLATAELHNLYGPTEAAIDVTFWRCQRHDARRLVPIGRPISNTQIYLLDGNLQPVPAGVAGELHIAGENLARGYLHRPELTAASFIPNPFDSRPGRRMYKTGDLARYVPDGEIEFLGRMDHQVKIRGFRIELGEVESALLAHPFVREAVVVARRDQRGADRLTAYVVVQRGSSVSQSDFRATLKEKLPAYMVPQDFVTLDALPLTASGKVDRRNLPPPTPPASRNEELSRVLAKLESLSNEEAQAILSEMRSQHAEDNTRASSFR